MATLRELIVKFSLKADTNQVKRFGEALENAKAAAMDLVAWGAKIASVYAAVGGALIANSASAANFAEEVMRSSTAFGISAGKYQESLFAFQALGASADDLADAYSTLAEKSLKAQRGGKEATQAFKDLGLSTKDLKGKNLAEMFDTVVSSAQGVKDTTKVVAAFSTMFGDDLGRRIARGLHASGSSFQDYIKIIRAVGGVFSDELLAKAQKAQIRFRLLGATFSTLRKRIGLELAPVFGHFAQKIVDWFGRNEEAVDRFVAALKEGVARELLRLELIATKVDSTVQRVFGGWEELAKAVGLAFASTIGIITGIKIAGVVSALIPLFQALTVGVVVLGAKIIAVAAAIAALVLIFEDLWVDMQGGDSFIGKLIDKFTEMGGIIGTLVVGALEFLRWHFKSLVDEFNALAGEAGPSVLALLKTVGSFIVGVLAGAIYGLVVSLITGARVLIWLARLVWAMAEAFVDAVLHPLSFLEQLKNALMTIGSWMRWAFEAAILEPIFWAIDKLLGLLSELPGIDFGGTTGVGERLAQSNLVDPGAFAAASDPGTGRGGGVGGVQNTQVNEWKPTINANSEAEGKDAARGFKKGLEEEGFFDSLRSYFSPGEV